MLGIGFVGQRRMGLGILVLLLLSHACAWAQDPKMVRIGVIRSAAIQVMEINQNGFEAALAGAGLKAGVNVIYDVQTIGGDPDRAQAILQKFLAEKVDLIHSIGTAPTRAALKATSSVPVVFSAVTDPVGAGIVPADAVPGKPSRANVTGISDRWPVSLQFETYAKIVPQAKKWGTIYNPAETNSISQVRMMRETAQKLGIELIEVSVDATGETRAAALALAGRVQAIFIIADSTVTADIQSVADACQSKRIPFFTGSAGSLSRGALAAFGIDYFLAGYAAGKKAALVLRGVNPGHIPWDLAEHFGLVINQKAAKSLGIVIPADMLRIADKVVE